MDNNNRIKSALSSDDSDYEEEEGMELESPKFNGARQGEEVYNNQSPVVKKPTISKTIAVKI